MMCLYSNVDISQRSVKRPNSNTSGLFDQGSGVIWPVCYFEVGNLFCWKTDASSKSSVEV